MAEGDECAVWRFRAPSAVLHMIEMEAPGEHRQRTESDQERAREISISCMNPSKI